MALTARVSHYWPPLGGPNCARFQNGRCLSATASGEPWEAWVNRGAACVPEWPFGTVVVLPGGERFVCVDRGGKVVTNPDGVPWIDLLVEVAPVPYGTDVPVRVLFPSAGAATFN